MSHRIVVERRVSKRLQQSTVLQQIQHCTTQALKGVRGQGWTFSVPSRITNPSEEEDSWVYRVVVNFSTTSKRESIAKKWPDIVKRFASAGAAGQLKGTPWKVVEPEGFESVAVDAKNSAVKAVKMKELADTPKRLGEISLDKGQHFDRIYGRAAHINRVVDALRLAKQTDWLKRTHSLLDGPPGCHVAGTRVILANGDFVFVEDVKEGQKLLSHDGFRTVQQLVRGTGRLYRVVPIKGDWFVVNEDHILTLSRSKGKRKGDLLDVSVKEWLAWSNNRKSNYKLIRSDEVEFDVDQIHELDLPIPPYALGLLLGDGSIVDGQSPRFTCHEDDVPFVPEITYLAEQFGLNVRCYPRDGKSGCVIEMALTGTQKVRNPLMETLSELDLEGCDSGEKFIPHGYKVASARDRLELLAGYIDTDGEEHGGVMTTSSKSKQLSNDVAFVARSLGFAAYLSEKEVDGKIYHVVNLSGNLSRIPCRHVRKRAAMRKQIKSVLRTGFSVEPAGYGDYYGFVLDGDHRYLMSDFTITHNCGKTEIMKSTAAMIGEEGKSWLWFDATSMTKAGVIELVMESDTVPGVLFIEEIEKCPENDLRWLLGVMDVRGQIRRTNYRVGNQAKNVRMVVIATANDINLLRTVMAGALYSRFQNKIYCAPPDRTIMEQILLREVKEIKGDERWIEPTLKFAVDKWGMDDPRDIITILSCGGDRLMTGKYQIDYEATMHPLERKHLERKKAKAKTPA
jgi:intein/homing endonuclease